MSEGARRSGGLWPVVLAAFQVAAHPLAVVQEVLVVLMLPWAIGAGGMLAGPVVVAVAERTTGPLFADSGSQRGGLAVAVSVVTGGLWVLGSVRFGVTPVLVAWSWACALAWALVITDVHCRRLPFPLVAALAGGGAVGFLAAAALEGRWARLGFACGAGVVVFGLAGLVQAWMPEHTGGGDTALYGAVAVYAGWFGWEGLLRGLLMATGLTGLVALMVVVCSRRLDARFPAGPSLLVGALLSMVFA
ncbi:methyltransferase [Amycolatopsis pigmentata]|uniref:Methyltransferase n=1 Tax=Amycolatopsis pigmentata TaxID=450801 RepID=A0ABW5G6R3_9PSEU